MMPVGPLMVEHRLIERMIALVAQEARRIRATGRVDADFVLSAIDFIRTYADRCHHGKEEHILFRALRKKPLSAEHREMLEELEADHVKGREITRRLALARERLLHGERAAATELADLMEQLVAYYPKHIHKEDERFFEPCMAYFSPEELDELLEDGRDFDRQLIQVMYESLVRKFEPAPAGTTPTALGAPGQNHTCMMCGYTYDPRTGDAIGHIPPGTPFDALPDSWRCPHCHASRSAFIRAKE